MKKHLAVFSKEGLEQIISGKKTIETRFSKKSISPFGQVHVGDIVYLKLVGGEIKGQFKVLKVINFEGLEKKDWEIIKKNYWDKITLGTKELDEAFEGSFFGTLIFIGNVEQFITSPIIYKKKDQRGWVVLD